MSNKAVFCATDYKNSCHTENQTSVTEFVLLSLTDILEFRITLFGVFLAFYLLNVTGNFFILVITILEKALHTPMYYFLGNVAFFDIFFSSVTVPKMLADFFSTQKTISFNGCISQLHFFHFMGGSEVILLTVMSYDRLIAIGDPLHYFSIISPTFCVILIFGSWMFGFLHSLLHTVLTAILPYCGPNLVEHFFCDIKPLLKLACTDTTLNQKILNIITGYLTCMAFLLTLISYVLIGRIVLKMKTVEGRKRAISTCSGHLTVVILLYGTALFTYIRPATQDILDQDRGAAVLFTVVTPALNPIIYTLRNKDMKKAISRVIKKLSL
ncbi:olfactory receptor 12D2 [Xenopus laevis]|uniref:Olfactory receptor 12D2 n=2 Tax=Xenopus laevis TaxID=8355 RepID=A0A1L8FBE6_XENLA|nr:olfactory receptor 12D2 [Xenopus laevis]OCT68915.1 hypothetical protein XELAEV_18040223mg [Xenopus laevis]